MAAYPKPKFDEFIRRVKITNSRFDKVRASSLRPLIAILKDAAGDEQKVRVALFNLPAAKQAKSVCNTRHLQKLQLGKLLPNTGPRSVRRCPQICCPQL